MSDIRDIYISYVEEDSGVADKVAHGLEDLGYTTWLYGRDSIPAMSYLLQISNAITNCRVVMLVISDHCLKSKGMDKEIIRALEADKAFLPILVNISWMEFQKQQPTWAQAIGGRVGIAMTEAGVAAILPRLDAGLKALGVMPKEVVESSVGISPDNLRNQGTHQKKVFISYSTKNATEAEIILRALEDTGIECWIAPRDVPPGKPWGGVINRAIIESRVFLILVTEDSNASSQVLKEVGIADHHKKLIIPFFLSDVTLSDDLSYYLTSLHWLVARAQPWENQIPELVEVLRNRLANHTAGSTAAASTQLVSLPPPDPREPTAGTTRVREKDGMTELYVPAGAFQMGSDHGNDDEKPPHKVYLDGYWIDQTPITNAMYTLFLNQCASPIEKISEWYDPDGGRIYLDKDRWQCNLSSENKPVASVTWFGAQAYAEWVGAHLPTEAQWEKAARGAEGRIYPWGNTDPNATLANFGKNIGTTTPVGAYPTGASPYGALDMAGNVWEWCADVYWDKFYQVSPDKNPHWTAKGENRVVRGGSWYIEAWYLRASYRGKFPPGSKYIAQGFRCCRPT